jgi:hypothetical protein
MKRNDLLWLLLIGGGAYLLFSSSASAGGAGAGAGAGGGYGGGATPSPTYGGAGGGRQQNYPPGNTGGGGGGRNANYQPANYSPTGSPGVGQTGFMPVNTNLTGANNWAGNAYNTGGGTPTVTLA